MSIASDLFAFSNPYGAQAQGKWNLTPGDWVNSRTNEKVVFFYETRAGDEKGVRTAIDQITDTGGRRLAKYEYIYTDGQKVKDLGRKAETYSFNIKFHGPNYQSKLKEFYNKVYSSRDVGKLTHPVLSAVRGAIDCRLESFEPVHRHDESNSVTFRAVFVEDNSSQMSAAQATVSNAAAPTALQNALGFLVQSNNSIGTGILEVGGLLQTPSAVLSALKAQKNGVVGAVSGLLGKLGATFGSKSSATATLAQTGGSPATATAGTISQRTSVGSTETVNLPPAFQTGLDSAQADFVTSQLNSFVNANQVTTQQAVFEANNVRSQIGSAIKVTEDAFGNDAFDIVLAYRQLAVTVQDTVEACITSAQSRVKVYVLERPMSVRAIAFANGLSPDRCADIDSLNPYLPSLNLVPRGSSVVVPAS